MLIILSDSNPEETKEDEVTSDEDFGSLTDEKMDVLAASIPADAMETTAEEYMDISFEEIMDIKDKNRQDTVAFNKEIIERWASQIPESEQAKVFIYNFYRPQRSYEGYVFRSVCQEFCSQGSRVSRHTAKEEVEGFGRGGV